MTPPASELVLDAKSALINLSVEEENLATIPFAVLERRVGKRISKLEVRGTKICPDGTEMQVMWQVQGNSDLGLPTEQDLDIFVALGVLTFRSNFDKTVTFTGREIAKILGITNVHGKFYQRLKMAMDRFIPLRFRAVAANERQEEIKWRNVFQEASFSLDRATGRCVGTVTWTDKLIESMNSGFFRLLDAGRYMQLDGITAKHLYRFLTIAFERNDMVLIDAKKLASEHLGIVNVPKYLSRLMQTLEPAFEQLREIEVLGSWHVASAEDWRIALCRHPRYVPERKALMLDCPGRDLEANRTYCQTLLQDCGLTAKAATVYTESAFSADDFYGLERAAKLQQAMAAEGVLPHVGLSVIRKALDAGAGKEEGRELLDWVEIAIEVCRQKKLTRQNLKNAGGLIIKIIKDEEARERLVSPDQREMLTDTFRRREGHRRRLWEEEEERGRILEYEEWRDQMAQQVFHELPEQRKALLRTEKRSQLNAEDRFRRVSPEVAEAEIDQRVMRDLAKTEVAPYQRWLMRQQAQQSLLLFQQ